MVKILAAITMSTRRNGDTACVHVNIILLLTGRGISLKKFAFFYAAATTDVDARVEI